MKGKGSEPGSPGTSDCSFGSRLITRPKNQNTSGRTCWIFPKASADKTKKNLLGPTTSQLYLHQASGLQERQAVLWFVDELLNLFAQLGQLLPDLEVGDHALLIGDLDGVILLLVLLDF